MGYALALLSAAAYGAGDFIGGLSSRHVSTLLAVLVSQVSGLVLLVLTLAVLREGTVAAPDLMWGAAAGLSGGTGVALLYRGLAVGSMAIVAPVTAVCAVAFPVLVAMAFGERPAPLALAGIVLALVSIVLVSQQDDAAVHGVADERRGASGLQLALLSGVAIGGFFICLARASSGAGLWPLLASRSASVILFAVAALAVRLPMRVEGRLLALLVFGGCLDMTANLLYLLASRRGPLSVMVTLASLYPASTVVLARVILGERLNGVQGLGIGGALTAVVLIVGS